MTLILQMANCSSCCWCHVDWRSFFWSPILIVLCSVSDFGLEARTVYHLFGRTGHFWRVPLLTYLLTIQVRWSYLTENRIPCRKPYCGKRWKVEKVKHQHHLFVEEARVCHRGTTSRSGQGCHCRHYGAQQTIKADRRPSLRRHLPEYPNNARASCVRQTETQLTVSEETTLPLQLLAVGRKSPVSTYYRHAT